ncbi:unnamed protein product [Moneuplotes crassus]|uniref:Uncharacterized protein n=1 Tax=Euplotes crassus TaxID=5936 RepID=A0AAD1Y6Y6_EUPCR|nr:unnamed protein product [Moneuplotes crassus]
MLSRLVKTNAIFTNINMNLLIWKALGMLILVRNNSLAVQKLMSDVFLKRSLWFANKLSGCIGDRLYWGLTPNTKEKLIYLLGRMSHFSCLLHLTWLPCCTQVFPSCRSKERYEAESSSGDVL